MKLAPSLNQTYQRRHWLLATSILENVLFSAVLLGWPALLSMLKAEGYYENLCAGGFPARVIMKNASRLGTQELLINMSPKPDVSAQLLVADPQSLPFIHSTPGCCVQDLYTCPEQEKKLNLCFTVGSFLLSALTFPIGVALERFGSRWLRMLGGILFGISCVLFACSSSRSPDILFFACALCGLGGNVVAFTSLQISNLFGPSRTTALGLLVGSYAAAAITFPTLKILYSLGASLQLLFLSLALLSLAIIINSWINLPNAPIPVNLDFSRLVESTSCHRRFHGQNKEENHEIPGDFHSPLSDVDLRVSEAPEDQIIMPLHRVIFLPLYLWSVIVICITQLRLLFFVGDLHHLLVQMTRDNPETVDLHIFIFGILQICCLGTTHFIGGFVDWRSKKGPSTDEDTHLLTQASLQPNNMKLSTKPIPPSSTTVSLLPDKLNQTQDMISPTPSAIRQSVLTHQIVPVHSTSLPVSPEMLSSRHTASGISASNSETFFNLRKSSLVHLVSTYSEPGTRKPSLTDIAPSAPEKRKLVKQQSAANAVHSAAKDLENKIRKLKDCAIIFSVTSTLALMFGLLVLIPTLTIQISTFVCYTLIRGFVPCAIGRLYSIAFRPVHHQTLIGLAFLISAIFSVIQHPLFVLTTDFLQGDPYWVNVGLLVLSLLCFGLPIHLLLHCNQLEEWRKTTMAPPQPVVVKMQYVDTKVTGGGIPSEL